MNLSSYHSDGKGFGVNNMKAPIHLLVSMFQTGGVMVLGIFLSRLWAQIKIV